MRDDEREARLLSPFGGGKAAQFPTVLIKSQSIRQEPGAEPELRGCIIYKESRKLEHTADSAGRPRGGRAGRGLWHKGKTRLLLGPGLEDRTRLGEGNERGEKGIKRDVCA